MASLPRIVTLALLALFAAGIVVHSANATTMSLEMVLSDAGAGDVADCQGCGGDGDDEESERACDIVCTVSFVASLGQVDMFAPRFADTPPPQGTEHLAGQTGPPEPYPPRSLI